MDSDWKQVGSTTLTPRQFKTRKVVTVKVPKIEYELIEVRWQSGIQVAREDTTIQAPHWDSTQNFDEDDAPDKLHFSSGSKRAGVYLIKGKGTHQLSAKVKVTKSTLSGTAILKGNLNGLQMEGPCPTSVGEHTVTLTIKNPPAECQQYEGDARWLLKTSIGIKYAPNTTRLEVYFILDNPAPFYKTGVWVEALRFLFRSVKVSGFTKPEEVAKRVTQFCHSEHGMKYDTHALDAHFNGTSFGYKKPFSLMRYITHTPIRDSENNPIGDGKTVNCYDQAGAVQSLSGALGVLMDWYYVDPFGYIKPTSLVGIPGKSNNPQVVDKREVYVVDEKGNRHIEKITTHTMQDQYKLIPVFGGSMLTRAPFGNHAFVGLAGKIYDACAGPALGTDDLYHYLKRSIDTEIRLKMNADQFKAQVTSMLKSVNLPSTGSLGDDYLRALTKKFKNPSIGLIALDYTL